MVVFMAFCVIALGLAIMVDSKFAKQYPDLPLLRKWSTTMYCGTLLVFNMILFNIIRRIGGG